MSASHKKIAIFIKKIGNSPRFNFLIFSLLLCSCTVPNEYMLRTQLANQGIVSLSNDNPYLAGNLFVAKEIDNSKNFKGFIQHKGTPDAVEVKKDLLLPYKVYLYYLNESEIYVMEQQADDWLIKGPAKISPQLMQSFINSSPSGPKAPLVNSFQETELSLPTNKRPKMLEEKIDTGKTKTPAKKDTKDNSSANKKAKKAAEAKILKPVKSEERETPQESSTSSSLDLSDSVSGDVNYRVLKNGEDLSNIVKWYTGSANNTGRVARINGIEEINKLTVDQVIRIPRYLLKTNKPYPQ